MKSEILKILLGIRPPLMRLKNKNKKKKKLKKLVRKALFPTQSRPKDLPSPYDILFEIFLRLPLKSLLRFRLVSKTWFNIIDDPCLATMHEARNDQDPPLLLLFASQVDKLKDSEKYRTLKRVSYVDYQLSMYELKEDGEFLSPASHKPMVNLVSKKTTNMPYTLESYCNGLLCFSEHRSADMRCFADDCVGVQSVLLCNPLRQECVRLPPVTRINFPLPNNKVVIINYGLGFSSRTNTYMVVRVVHPHAYYKVKDYQSVCNKLGGVEVYSLETKSWRKISSILPYPIRGRPAYANEAIHWIVDYSIVSVSDRHNLKGMIVSFDTKKEEFYVTHNPFIPFESFECCHLINLRGELAIVDSSNSCNRYQETKIWVLQDPSNQIWKSRTDIFFAKNDRPRSLGGVAVVGPSQHGVILEFGGVYNNFDTSHPRYIERYWPSYTLRFTDPKKDKLEVISLRGGLTSLKGYGNMIDEREDNWLNMYHFRQIEF